MTAKRSRVTFYDEDDHLAGVVHCEEPAAETQEVLCGVPVHVRG